jgi:hypothetical protein
MHINTNHKDRSAQRRALTAKTPFTQSGSNSPAEGADLMPFIGVGTFWVAALLRSGPHSDKPPDSDRADSQR